MKLIVDWIKMHICVSEPLFTGVSEIIFVGIFLLLVAGFIWNACKNKSFSPIMLISLIGALFMFLVAFCAPHYFVKELPIASSYASNLGSTIDGFMSPFIAIGAAILTFIAFWVQHSANQEMLRNNSKQQIERQFYELLKIHREKIDSLEWSYLGSEHENPATYKVTLPRGRVISVDGFTKQWSIFRHKGQEAIKIFLKEFCFIYECVDSILKTLSKEEKFSIAYKIFFEGLEKAYDEIDDEIDKKSVWRCLKKIKEAVNMGKGKFCSTNLFLKYSFERCNVFEGHRGVLNPYYRHLFLTVKIIVNSNYFSKDEKISYLKLLRAQMTSEEQMLLYYNWLSGYGSEWEEKKGNRFFTKYKMIHNIEEKDWFFLENEFYQIFPWMTKEEGVHLFEWFERMQKLQKKYDKQKFWAKIKARISKVKCFIVDRIAFPIGKQNSSN